MRDIPHSPVALYEVAHLFGTLVAETILASVHVRARKQAGHMGASDLIKALQNTLRGGGRPHKGECGLDPLLERIRIDESLPALARELFAALAKEYAQLQAQIDEVDA